MGIVMLVPRFIRWIFNWFTFYVFGKPIPDHVLKVDLVSGPYAGGKLIHTGIKGYYRVLDHDDHRGTDRLTGKKLKSVHWSFVWRWTQ